MEQVLALPTSDKTEEAFLREVDEELRREQALTLWRRWGRLIVGAVVLGLAVFGGVLFFQSRSEGAAGKQGEQFDAAIQALGANKPEAMTDLDKLSGGGGPAYRAAALFTESEVLAGKQDLKGAIAKLSAIADDSALPRPYRDRALVERTALEYDTLKPQAVVDRLRPLASIDSPWFGSAGEMVAAAYLKLGKTDAAGKLYGQLAQSKGFVPPSIRQRAVQMAGVLGVDAIDQSEEKKAK